MKGSLEHSKVNPPPFTAGDCFKWFVEYPTLLRKKSLTFKLICPFNGFFSECVEVYSNGDGFSCL